MAGDARCGVTSSVTRPVKWSHHVEAVTVPGRVAQLTDPRGRARKGSGHLAHDRVSQHDSAEILGPVMSRWPAEDWSDSLFPDAGREPLQDRSEYSGA